MTADNEKSFKAKLRTLARAHNRDPADLWQNLMLERFLVRLERSKYADHFILKGAILLSKYLELGRETKDLDFLAYKLSNSINPLTIVFEEIISIDLQDGFEFKNVDVSKLAHPHMSYQGATATMMCYFGKTRSKIVIDIGFGDIVHQNKKSIQLMHSAKGPLFERDVQLNCYPKEYIFAEKLETLVYRGGSNSRMKDYHDVYTLISSFGKISFHRLGNIIALVFDHRKTPFSFPIEYTDHELDSLQNLWINYLKKLRPEVAEKVPKNIRKLIEIINDRLPNYLDWQD